MQLYFDDKNFQYFLKDDPNPDEITEIMKLNSNPYLLLHQDVMPGLNWDVRCPLSSLSLIDGLGNGAEEDW